MKKVQRPVLRWHGGKWRLAPWIISHFPAHKVYVEPYGGAASILLRKHRSYGEIYNDLDDDVVNLFNVLRSHHAGQLIKLLELTPFSRKEFEASYRPLNTPLEKARCLIIRSYMGFGSDGHNGARMTGFRANSNRSGTTPAHDWKNYPQALVNIIERISGVVIEHRPAMQVMAQHDSEETLHYVDPPYVHSTRSPARNSTRKNYTHEMDDSDHIELLKFLRTLKGHVVLSGYANPIYDELLKGWESHKCDALADGAHPREEIIWINPKKKSETLFD